MKTAYTSVEMGCFTHCMQVTPHDLYSKCRVCGNTNQEKKSPSDAERERDAVRRAVNKLSGNSWDMGL